MIEMSDSSCVGVFLSALIAALVPLLWAALVRQVWRPYAVARAFAQQGIRGPPYRFYVGNTRETRAMLTAANSEVLERSSNDIVGRVMPHVWAWASLYGKVFLSWTGSTPRLWVGDLDMAKRILSDKAGLYVKPDAPPALMAVLGQGLLSSEGDDWARHRRILHAAFTMDRLKSMMPAMAACAAEMIGDWEAHAATAAASVSGDGVTVEVGQRFHELTADVISHAAFGSSYRQGKEVFLAQRELLLMAFASINRVHVPGMDHVPTKTNVRRWQLERTMRGTLMAIIAQRLATAKESMGYGHDLLGLMLEANAGGDDDGKSRQAMSMDEIINECQTFFAVGHDTTAHLLTWTMFLLGTHPEWQQRLRKEVLCECSGAEVPLNGDALNKLKLVTMVLYETLRLYGPGTTIVRQAAVDVELCGLKVPKGTHLAISFPMLHRDEEVWGADAMEFDPLRFRDGMGKAAAHPNALLAFSLGPRSCIGQDFAMLEAKVTLAFILRRFAFEVAPEYVHAPADLLTLQPSRGLPVVLRRLDPHSLDC